MFDTYTQNGCTHKMATIGKRLAAFVIGADFSYKYRLCIVLVIGCL